MGVEVVKWSSWWMRRVGEGEGEGEGGRRVL